ncbi:MAG: glycoside hydrolase family 5 protein [Bacteroidaceae bacterium]|nr:glycoside hydrolase family 5 protein [Bacteroidaceae bacterium]
MRFFVFIIVLTLSQSVACSQNARTMLSHMGIGWNLGNTLEAYNSGNGIDSETSWGNVRTEKWMIDSIAKAGFRSVRIPVRWYPHFSYADGRLRIDPDWLSRVKEVVGYCLDDDLYVIINTHHELWLEGSPFYADSSRVYKQFRDLWTEIALAFRDYDHRLLFAGTNEVHVGNDWGRPKDENSEVQNGYNQVFVDAVRATGGRNKTRNLVVQTYAANADFGLELFRMPHDKVKNHLIVEVHNYDPYQYGLTDEVRFWGRKYVRYGTVSSDDETVAALLYQRLKEQFTDKGIPFIVGEMGANYHTASDRREQALVEASCADYYRYVIRLVRQSGGVPFIWDNGQTFRRGKECFGLFDRRNRMKCQHPLVIEAVRLQLCRE